MIGAGVRLYVYMIYDPNKSLNGTLAVDSPFQTLTVDFSLHLYTSSTTACSRNAFLVEYIKDFLAPCSICPKDDITLVTESYRTRQQAESLQNWVRIDELHLSCYRYDVKKE